MIIQTVLKLTCRMAVQYSFYNFTLLCRAALPGLAGDDVIAITLAAFRAVLVSEPSVSHLHTHAHRHTQCFHHFRGHYIDLHSFFLETYPKNNFKEYRISIHVQTYFLANKIQEKFKSSTLEYPILYTYRPILSVPISTATLAERNTFVSTEDKTRVTDASLHAGLVAGATVACRLLTAGLGAGGAT